MSEEWKSPRKIELDIRDYQRARFEAYMQMVDDGTLPRALGIAAMQEEMDNLLWVPPNPKDHESSVPQTS